MMHGSLRIKSRLKRIVRNTAWNKYMKLISLSSFSSLAIVFALMSVAGTSASAQLYKWTDANGKVHYSDSVPPEANDAARKEIRPDGTVRKNIDRAPTAEERRMAAEKAEYEKKARAVTDERERKDKALLATYANLGDFDRVRDRALAAMDSEVEAFTKQAASATARRAELQKDIDAAGKKGPSVKLANEVADVEKQLNEAQTLSTKRAADRVTMANTYASERVRLAGLIQEQAAANAAANPAAKTTAVNAATSNAATANAAAPTKAVKKP
jgi:uncharacterized protein YoxC